LLVGEIGEGIPENIQNGALQQVKKSDINTTDIDIKEVQLRTINGTRR